MGKAFDSLIGIYGGTFDPVHFGHLRIAEELYEKIDLSGLYFVPSGAPRLRQLPETSGHHRIEMLRLAIQGNSRFIIDDREIYRPGESRSVITLRELRCDIAENSVLCFLMGRDVFLKLSDWYHWKDMFELCHIVVVERPGYIQETASHVLPDKLQYEFNSRQIFHADELKQAMNGLILTVQASMLDISATVIRRNIANLNSVRYLLPDAVLEYIKTNHLYSNKICKHI